MLQDSSQSNQGFYTSGFCSPNYSWLPAARASVPVRPPHQPQLENTEGEKSGRRTDFLTSIPQTIRTTAIRLCVLC